MLGQALIQHDLRSEPWPDFAALAAMFGQADLCFTDQEKQSAAGRRKRRRARGIDAGASLYVSHGAPRLHGIEIYRGRPIFYQSRQSDLLDGDGGPATTTTRCGKALLPDAGLLADNSGHDPNPGPAEPARHWRTGQSRHARPPLDRARGACSGDPRSPRPFGTGWKLPAEPHSMLRGEDDGATDCRIWR